MGWSVRTNQSYSPRTQTTMALDQSALRDLLAHLKLTDVTDRTRSATETLRQELIDAEAIAFVGACPFERSAERTTQSNGTRPRTLTTPGGDLGLRNSKRRLWFDQALFAVVMEACVHRLSTRKVDDLVTALGVDPAFSQSAVSRIGAGLNVEVAEFRDRTLSAQDFPHVFLNATYCKALFWHRIVSWQTCHDFFCGWVSRSQKLICSGLQS